jgi:FtsP/CotA-like multicopper oxidase with cupredoxin domain
MYHCHVEAAEHMQMGMLGSLYVRAAQDKVQAGAPVCAGSSFTHQAGLKYAYNDCDGSTRYNVDFPIQIGSFDPEFHDADESVQPLPFSLMRDKYPMLNGRGYPDTVQAAVPAPAKNGGKATQLQNSLVQATAGQRILLRLSNLNVTRFYTLQTLGMPMMVVGKDAKLLRGPDGKNLYYKTNSVTLGGGESVDVILDTAGVAPGTYFLYASQLNYLVNNDEAATGMGGMLTEIRVL